MNPFYKYDKIDNYKLLWFNAIKSPLYCTLFFFIAAVGYGLYIGLPKFLMYKQGLPGSLIFDPITSNFDPFDFNPYIFYITTIVIFIGKLISLYTPRRILQMLFSLVFLNLVRIVCLYFINLEAPIDIIPLYDPFLEMTFYKDVLITKDLFFSGHTSNIIIFGFLSRKKWVRNCFFTTTFVVASMLVLQHVHYTIDVLAAPFVAYFIYLIFDWVFNILADRQAII